MRVLRNRLAQLVVDAVVVAAALAMAYSVRFEGFPPRLYWKQFILIVPYLVILRLSMAGLFGVYRLVWRYVTLRDVPRILGATVTGSVILTLARLFLGPVMDSLGLVVNDVYVTVPWGVICIEFLLASAGLVGARALWRFTKEEVHRKNIRIGVRERPRALLAGAGSAGVMVARDAKSNPHAEFQIVGFVDDDPAKIGTIIHGFRVLGTTDRLPDLAEKFSVDVAVITIGNAPAKAVRRIVDLAEQGSLRVQIIPDLNEILAGRVSISKVRDVAIEDLLGREPVDLDEDLIAEFIRGKTVLVTGAGGSIGSEICRQVARFAPRKLVLLDQAENPLFHIHRELLARPGAPDLLPVVGNVANRERIAEILGHVRPDVMFHAAAHKHVPLMEANPGEAIRNNILGSRNVADLAHEFSVEAFVMISTDKAVNPSSVMGASKRVAELYVQSLAERSSTRFITVRFGNVLGSEGSVIPVFKEQIARGGPVTVTHPEMTRYFMTIPEASQLVLQASAMGEGGEIFVLEMGTPVAIVELARDLIRLSGLRPGEDVEIVYTGIRPGEKLFEEISLSEENAAKTRHPRIWIGRSRVADHEQAIRDVETLAGLIDAGPEEIRSALHCVVPEYRRRYEHPTIADGKPDEMRQGRIEGSPRAAPLPRPSSA